MGIHLKNIIDNLEPFGHVFYKNCYYNCLFSVLEHFQVPVASFMINDSYFYCIKGSLLHMETCTLYNEDEWIESLGIRKTSVNTCDNILEYIISAIDDEQPLIVYVDYFYESIRPDVFQKVHGPHTLLIYGYDRQLSIFYVIEHSNRDSLAYKKKQIHFTDVSFGYQGYLTYFHEIRRHPTVIIFSYNHLVDKKLHIPGFYQFIHKHYGCQKSAYRQSLIDLHKYADEIDNYSDINLLPEALMSINDIIQYKKIESYRWNMLSNGVPLEVIHSVDFIMILEEWERIRIQIVKANYVQMIPNDFNTSISKSLQIILKNEKHNCEIIESLCERNEGNRGYKNSTSSQ